MHVMSYKGEIRQIQEIVARLFCTNVMNLTSKNRAKSLIAPRHIAMLLCRRLTKASLNVIAHQFGARDHTSIIHGIRNAERLINEYPNLACYKEKAIMEFEARSQNDGADSTW